MMEFFFLLKENYLISIVFILVISFALFVVYSIWRSRDKFEKGFVRTSMAILILFILIISLIIRLWRRNKALQTENIRLMKKTGEYEVMKDDARKLLKTTEEIKTIKLMREKYNLTLVDAQKIVDSVK